MHLKAGLINCYFFPWDSMCLTWSRLWNKGGVSFLVKDHLVKKEYYFQKLSLWSLVFLSSWGINYYLKCTPWNTTLTPNKSCWVLGVSFLVGVLISFFSLFLALKRVFITFFLHLLNCASVTVIRWAWLDNHVWILNDHSFGSSPVIGGVFCFDSLWQHIIGLSE